MKRLIKKSKLTDDGFETKNLSAGFSQTPEYALNILRNNIEGNNLIVYHGTLLEYVDNIMNNGITGDEGSPIASYGPAFSTKRGQAINFAIDRKKIYGDKNSKIVLLTIAIPQNKWYKIKQNVSDYAYQYGEYGEIIPSGWIINQEIITQ
ncbi:MAG: hypothetical protein ACOCP8_06885 [archaeon]